MPQTRPKAAQKPREALIVIDIQRDFCAGGALSTGDDESFIMKANALIDAYSCVILTQDWHPPGHIGFAAGHPHKAVYDTVETAYGAQILWPEHCIAGTLGAQFHPQLNTESARLILRKGLDKNCDSYSAFAQADGKPTGLRGFLRESGVEKLTFCGVATDFCVAASVLDALKFGFQARVALAASQAADINGSYDRALAAMRAAGAELGLFC